MSYWGNYFGICGADCSPEPVSGSLYSPADVMRRLLISLGYLTSPSLNLAWPAYIAGEPTTPDNCVTFYDTQGRDFGGDEWGNRLEHRGFQIRVRAIDHHTGYGKARQLAEVLDRDILRDTVEIADDVMYCVHSVDRSSDAVCLGKETPTSKRSLFTVNAVVSLRLLETS